MKIEVSYKECGRLTGPYTIGQDDAITVGTCSCAEIETEKLQARIAELEKELAMYQAGNVPITDIITDNEAMAIRIEDLEEQNCWIPVEDMPEMMFALPTPSEAEWNTSFYTLGYCAILPEIKTAQEI